MALRADREMITSARFAFAGHSTLRPGVEPVGKEFVDQRLPAGDARGSVRDFFVAEMRGRHLAGKAVVLIVEVLEQFLAEALAFAEEHPTWAAFPVEAEDAR